MLEDTVPAERAFSAEDLLTMRLGFGFEADCAAVGAAAQATATDSRWSVPPSFPDARGALVSTAGDLLRFVGALLDGGKGIISPATVLAMTTDRLTPQQRRSPCADVPRRLWLGLWGADRAR